mgnify:CR=1 FL=1
MPAVLSVNMLDESHDRRGNGEFAMLGDISSGGAWRSDRLCRSSGIEQTIGQKLPAGFQSSEFLLEARISSTGLWRGKR